jgi:hypothetical protein
MNENSRAAEAWYHLQVGRSKRSGQTSLHPLVKGVQVEEREGAKEEEAEGK